MRRRPISVIVWIAIVLAATSPSAQTPTATTRQTPAPAPTGNAENGKALFVKNGCYQCHNYEGQGGAAGARLAPNPIPFRGLLAYVRAPRGDMPPYTPRVMSDQDVADVYAFLQSRPRPTAPPAFSVRRGVQASRARRWPTAPRPTRSTSTTRRLACSGIRAHRSSRRLLRSANPRRRPDGRSSTRTASGSRSTNGLARR